MAQPRNADPGMDVIVFGMITTAWQRNVNTLGLIDGIDEGTLLGMIEGTLLGPVEGKKEGVDGAEVGVNDRGSELQVDKPEFAHAGYTQAGVETKGVFPNVVGV